mmetsp:Transcript_2397/g.5991  ORF Transcript_2397/g.5991 Transcript_2397/m.5991 type:complete len:265 (-) Transcript_2397:312-1106(-)
MSQPVSARASRPEKQAAREARRNSQTRRSHSASNKPAGEKALLAEASEIMDAVRTGMVLPVRKVLTPESGPKGSPTESCISTESPPSPLQLPSSALDDSDTWPSLHAAVEGGWELCREADDTDAWHMPEEATMQPFDEPDFILLTLGSPTKQETPSQKLMFSQVVMQNLPKAGQQTPPAICQLSKRRSSRTQKEVIAVEDKADDRSTHYEDFSDLWAGSHGWRKKHKVSWSVKQSRRVAEKAEQRKHQSMKDRGLLDNDNEEEE